MGRRSLSASESGIRKAKQAFHRRGWTQSELAMEVGLATRQPVWKFFSGRPVERAVFIDICFRLDLDWEEIAGIGPSAPGLLSSSDVLQAELCGGSDRETIASIRQHLWQMLQTQGNWLPVSLDLSQPLPLMAVYVNQQVWEIPRQSHYCLKNDTWDSIVQILPRSPLTEIVTQNSQIFLKGALGSGKTTALRFLFTECLRSNLLANQIPILWILSNQGDFATQLQQQWQLYGLQLEQMHQLARLGKLVLLLDGFDQLAVEQRDRLRAQILQWTQVNLGNSIIITSRTGCDEAYLSGFRSVELAGFEEEQVKDFAQKWFSTVQCSTQQPSFQDFLIECNQKEASELRALMASPLLLHVCCLHFAHHGSLKQSFSQLYEAILELLLRRWNRIAGHSPLQEEELTEYWRSLITTALSSISIGRTAPLKTTYASKLSEQEIWPNALFELLTHPYQQTVLQTLSLDYGILERTPQGDYQFVSPGLCAYLTALSLTNLSKGKNQVEVLFQSFDDQDILQGSIRLKYCLALVSDSQEYLTQLLLWANKDLESEESLQSFLGWINRKSESINTHGQYPLNGIRSFYWGICVSKNLELVSRLEPQMLEALSPELHLDLMLIRALNLGENLEPRPNQSHLIELRFALDLEVYCQHEPSIASVIQHLCSQFPPLTASESQLQTWWQEKGQQWFTEFRQVCIEHRDIGHLWKFGEREKASLQRHETLYLSVLDAIQDEYLSQQIDPALIRRLIFSPQSELNQELIFFPATTVHSLSRANF